MSPGELGEQGWYRGKTSRPLFGAGFLIDEKGFYPGIDNIVGRRSEVMKLTGAQMVCESLIREGVDVVFGLPGGAILSLYQTIWPPHLLLQLRHRPTDPAGGTNP